MLTRKEKYGLVRELINLENDLYALGGADMKVLINGDYFTVVALDDGALKTVKVSDLAYKPASPVLSDNSGEVYEIKDVIFNDPATIIKWSDGTKTVVKCQDGDKYDMEKGFAFCILKKICGPNFNELFKEFVWKDEH